MTNTYPYRLLLQTGETIDGPIYRTLARGRTRSPEQAEAHARRKSETYHGASIWIVTADARWAVSATAGEG